MILNSCFEVRNLIWAAVLLTSLSFVTHATAQERSFLVDLNSKTATDLGTLGGTLSEATGINAVGQVVGISTTVEGAARAFVTGPNGMGMKNLGTFGGNSLAFGINDPGQVVGSSATTGGCKPKPPKIPSVRNTCPLHGNGPRN